MIMSNKDDAFFTKGEISMPLTVFNTYLGYISMTFKVADDKASYKELINTMVGDYPEEELEKWFWQAVIYVATLHLDYLKAPNERRVAAGFEAVKSE